MHAAGTWHPQHPDARRHPAREQGGSSARGTTALLTLGRARAGPVLPTPCRCRGRSRRAEPRGVPLRRAGPCSAWPAPRASPAPSLPAGTPGAAPAGGGGQRPSETSPGSDGEPQQPHSLTLPSSYRRGKRSEELFLKQRTRSPCRLQFLHPSSSSQQRRTVP